MVYDYESQISNSISKDKNYFFTTTSKDMKDELQEVYRKAKAFDTFLKYNQHVEKYKNSDCHELERVFQGVIKEYEERADDER